VLSGAFKQAMAWGWAGHNPAKLATPPTTGRTGVSPPDAASVARLLTAAMAEDPELGLFLRLAVVLGARRGELLGLKWRDVDLAAGEVLIASSVARVVGRPLLDKDTKTHAKRRVALEESRKTDRPPPPSVRPIVKRQDRRRSEGGEDPGDVQDCQRGDCFPSRWDRRPGLPLWPC
jgi:integrase